jgi:hypothetical protein
MTTLLAMLCILFGAVSTATQAVSWIHPELARKLGFQERSSEAASLYRKLEWNTARWDTLVLWTPLVAGSLMLVGHPWAAPVALIAGGIYLDAGGREASKYIGLRENGVGVGSSRERAVAYSAYSAISGLGLALIAWALLRVASS